MRSCKEWIEIYAKQTLKMEKMLFQVIILLEKK